MGASINLADLNGTNGFVINGIDEFDSSGRSVSNAGDINGDGFDDLIIGSANSRIFIPVQPPIPVPGSTPISPPPRPPIAGGESYVVFGRANVGNSGSLNLSELNGTDGFLINGVNRYDRSGTSVSNAGDVNGDGFDDLIIGATGADPNGNSDAGESYVVFGGANVGSSGSLELTDLNGTNGFVINGVNRYDRSGTSVSNAGDVNGDGFDAAILIMRIIIIILRI